MTNRRGIVQQLITAASGGARRVVAAPLQRTNAEVRFAVRRAVRERWGHAPSEFRGTTIAQAQEEVRRGLREQAAAAAGTGT
jgi:hypothetical protein